MLSKSKAALRRLYLKSPLWCMKISTKITCLYAAILLLVLVLTSVIMGLGTYYTFYHEAETEIKIAMERMQEGIEESSSLQAYLNEKDLVPPGIVLRVTDITGRIVYETDSHYPSLDVLDANRVKNPPFWANKDMDVVKLDRFVFYHAKMDVVDHGQFYQLHFFRTITAENVFLEDLQILLFIITIAGFIIALAAGYFLSRRILQPIRDLTQTARKIEVERMDRRIEVPPAKDELSELALTFNHMLDRLERGFKQQQRFVSDASHELRTPVTVILGYSDLLSRWGRKDTKVLDEGIAAIRSEAEDMQDLIEKLLFLARADQKRQILHKDYVNLAEIVDDAVRKMKLVTKNHTVTLTANEAGTIYADPATMRQMMRIFLENAVKYTPEGGHITISSRRMPGEKAMKLVFADDGIGIAEDDQKKIFERFYRADSSRTKAAGSVGGTGLGLSIASWIAEQHDIKIEVESQLGEGTKFILTIPLAAEQKKENN
ncbi:sensor histidine kinase [Mitsuokella sp.]|uniref:sensor histidine kinase n=1 Tax=Mitsuokella sp. TaxID=2049034 RepID=UPI003D7D37C0